MLIILGGGSVQHHSEDTPRCEQAAGRLTSRLNGLQIVYWLDSLVTRLTFGSGDWTFRLNTLLLAPNFRT